MSQRILDHFHAPGYRRNAGERMMHFHPDTPNEVRNVLDIAANAKGYRVRLFYGDVMTGRCWNDEWEMIGTIGRSTGKQQIPLLIKNSRSMGGAAILDHCIIAIQNSPGHFAYQHPLFATGIWTIGPPTHDGYVETVLHNDKPHAQFKRYGQALAYIYFMRGERWSKAPIGRQKTAARFPGWRNMTGAQRRNARMHEIFERAARLQKVATLEQAARSLEDSRPDMYAGRVA